MQMELTILHGHTYAVRRVRCSPHAQGLIASCSYDMTMRMWDMESPNSLLQVFEHHTGALF
jgi:peroxin-7